MYQTGLPQAVLKIVGNIVKDWKCDRIFVGSSNNFAIERTISNIVNCPITSNDVTIYSLYIGKFFAGESLENLKIKEDYAGECRFFEKYMNTDVEKIATLILAADIIPYDNADIAYCKRMMIGYKAQFDRMHKKLCEKLESIKTNVDEFKSQSLNEFMNDIPNNCGFVSFPPFFNGAYESVWNKLSMIFDYDEPKHEVLDAKKHMEQFCNKLKTFDNFVVIMEKEVPKLDEFFAGCSNTKGDKPFYIYSKTMSRHYIKKNSKETNAQPIVKISEDDKITENICIKKITIDQFNENRALYLSTGVTKVATPSASYGIFCEGKLFGIFALSNSQMLTGSEKLERPTIYLLTDFAVSPTCEKNLSKLVLYCVLSKEVKLLAEKIMGKRVKTITTNAFSKRPISMKYRGLFDLYGRRIVEKDENGNPTKYNLSYGAKAGQWTLEEGYSLWKQKS